MRLISAIALLNVCCFFSCNNADLRIHHQQKKEAEFISGSLDPNVLLRTPDENLAKHIHTESFYMNTNDNGVFIQNSYPKGGRYDATDSVYAYGIFFNAISNEKLFPIEVNINFLDSSLVIFDSINTEVKFFIPPDSLVLDQLDALNYGLDDLTFFENDTKDNKSYNRIIAPKEKAFIYVGILFKHTGGGPVRTRLEMIKDDLYYRVSFPSDNYTSLFPCGEIISLSPN